MTLDAITVVGASTAGLAAAGALRRSGFDGTLTLIGDEPHRTYDRPPLSKQYLSGDWEADRVFLAAADDPDLAATWELGSLASSLDVSTHTVELTDGRTIPADGVVLACGATPRRLPGTEGMTGVHTLRTLDQATTLRAEFLGRPNRVVVVGAGFIGAEVAATARGLGLDVTLVEPLEAPLARVLGVEVGSVFADMHHEAGVDVRLGVGVERCEADASGRVAHVVLSDGSVIDANVVVVGIGVMPNTEWLEGSGLRLDNGIVCDATCTAARGVVACGDVANWPNPVFDGEQMRVEHWDHAMAQAEHAAASLLAGDDAEAFGTVPWFWSDQYDRKVQLAGRVRPDDDMVIVEGNLAERRFVALFGRAGRLVGVLGMNRPRHVVQMRPKIAEHIGFDEALAAFA